jgi:hypothetical protein
MLNRRLAFLFLAILLASCTRLRLSTPPTPAKPPARQPAISMDTIRWTPNPHAKPPITEAEVPPIPPRPGSKETYTIALLLSATADEDSNVPNPDALQFYTGFRMALEDHSTSGGANLQVGVYDCGNTPESIVKTLDSPGFLKNQILVGPFKSGQVKVAAAWAKLHQKITLSPWVASAGLTTENPQFIQLNPSLRTHCEQIAQYINRQIPGSAVSIVVKEKERDRLSFFQEYQQKNNEPPFTEIIVPDNSTKVDKTTLANCFKPGKKSVLILPSWTNQDWIAAFLNQVKTTRGDHSVIVFGMPQWKQFESLDPELLTTLQVHISAPTHVNYQSDTVLQFSRRFYDLSATIPDDNAFNGFDTGKWLCALLAEYGTLFPHYLPGTVQRGLKGNFRMEGNTQPSYDDNLPSVHYLENKFTHILRFTPQGFQPEN